MDIKPKKRNKPRKLVPNDKRCTGLKTDGERCTRSKSGESEFCKSHMNVTDKKYTKSNKKRGRKPKIIPDEKMFDDNYIPVYHTIMNGMKVLIDFNNNVYSNDLENPVYLGKKTIYGLVKD